VQRNIASVHFNSGGFREFMAESVSETVNKRLIPVLADAAKRNQTVDLQDLFLRYTFDNTCSIVFGRHPGCLAVDLPQTRFAKAFDECVEATFYRLIMPRFLWKTLRFLTMGKERQLLNALKPLEEFVDDLIAFKKRTLMMPGGETRDLLSCFMRQFADSNELKVPDRFFRDMVLNFVIAGRDTSGVALAWFFWLLSCHPRIEEKIVQELSGILNRRSDSKKMEPFTAKELQECVYLHAALNETLRLYPSVPNCYKGALHKDVLPGGTCIESGMKFVYNIYALGRMESIWGPDCLEFKPERWIDHVNSCEGQLRMKNESAYKFLARKERLPPLAQVCNPNSSQVN
jgi:fatty acid omega-hydroxylase